MFSRRFSTAFFYILYYFLCATCERNLSIAADVYKVSQSTSSVSALRALRLPRSIDAPTAATYYNVTSRLDRAAVESFWHAQQTKAKTLKSLKATHRRAKAIRLPFEFSFYGASVRKLIIATGGFIYTGEHEHSAMLAASQYIAPLMANFETSTANDSNILIVQNATALTVLWQNVRLAHSHASGKFNFSATLHKSGDIVFTYLNVPMPVSELYERTHPVQLGLSDAYIIREMQRTTLHEYNRLTLPAAEAVDSRIIYLKALPNCLMHKDCTTCVQHHGNGNMKCVWCTKLKLCSTGLSRRRQQWLNAGCDQFKINNVESCDNVTLLSDELESEERTAAEPKLTDLNNNLLSTTSSPTRSCSYNADCSSTAELKNAEQDDDEGSRAQTNLEQTTLPAQTTTTLAAVPIAKPSTKSIEASKNKRKLPHIERNHNYYSSRMYVNEELTTVLWQRFLKMPTNEKLSGNYATVKKFALSFDFPYYGQIVRDVIVSTSGFISTSVSTEPFLMMLQRIAPLSGNFDPLMSIESSVRTQDNGTAFTVLWHKLQLHERPGFGQFSFSATLHDSGNIVFIYYALPTSLSALGTVEQPINVGLFDVFIINELSVDENATPRTIRVPYTIGDVHLPLSEVFNSTLVYLQALPACQQFDDCATCVVHTVGELRCAWCPALQRCSTGIDRRTQEWREHGCQRIKVNEVLSCPAH